MTNPTDWTEPVELTGVRWRKSIRSGGNGGDCVEIADNLAGVVAVRDSKDPAGPALRFNPIDWLQFITAAKTDRFDLR